MVNNLPLNAGDKRDSCSIPESEISLVRIMATLSNSLAWRIPQTEEPGELKVHRVAKSWA